MYVSTHTYPIHIYTADFVVILTHTDQLIFIVRCLRKAGFQQDGWSLSQSWQPCWQVWAVAAARLRRWPQSTALQV
eukprot:scaffold670870_cov60-Prasinocladus_malaysianus.AAC.2